MKKIVLSAALLCLAATSAGAQTCLPFTTSTDALPPLTGRVVYENFATGGLFLFDFQSNLLTKLNVSGWGLSQALNPAFSPDGSAIVFTAIHGVRRDVYYWRIGAAQPMNLTPKIAQPNEDPKYSPLGGKIVWKQNYGLATATVVPDPPDGAHITNFKLLFAGTPSGPHGEPSMPPEASGPVFSPSDKYVYYFANAKSFARVMRYDTVHKTSSSPFAFTPTDGVQYYYPADPDNYAFLYVAWLNPSTMIDKIYFYSMLDQAAHPWNATDCTAENSDPAPVDEDYFIFSRQAPGGSYQLYLGQIGDKTHPLSASAAAPNIWALPKLNGPAGDFRGANYTNARP